MKLNIIEDKIQTASASLGISEKRKVEIDLMVRDTLKNMRDQVKKNNGVGIPITTNYAIIAGHCETLEEYTFALHAFHIFVRDYGDFYSHP